MKFDDKYVQLMESNRPVLQTVVVPAGYMMAYRDHSSDVFGDKWAHSHVDGPNVIELYNETRAMSWFKKDGAGESVRHREDGPAVEAYYSISDSDIKHHKAWYKDGMLHREDGPADEYEYRDGDTIREWRQKGYLHRLDGPAIMLPDGTKQWWIEGNQYTEEQFNIFTAKSRTEIASVLGNYF